MHPSCPLANNHKDTLATIYDTGPHRYSQKSMRRSTDVRVMFWAGQAEMRHVQIRAMPIAMKDIGAPPAIQCNVLQDTGSGRQGTNHCKQKPYRLPVILANQGGHISYHSISRLLQTTWHAPPHCVGSAPLRYALMSLREQDGESKLYAVSHTGKRLQVAREHRTILRGI